MYSAFEDLHASSKCRHNYSVPVGHFLPGHLPFYTPPPRLTFIQLGTDIQEVLKVKSFSEPRLIVIVNKSNASLAQGFIAAEKELLFQIDNFSISEGIISLIATY